MNKFRLIAVCLSLALLAWGVAFADPTPPSAEAIQQWRADAEKGDAKAQCNLGNAYVSGQGVMQSYGEAVKWYRKAAEQGDAKAQYNLGVAYDTGRGVKKNSREAFSWFRNAADQGNAKAQYRVGLGCYIGKGMNKDQIAYGWLLLAKAGSNYQGAALEAKLAASLSPAELQAAQDWARQWKPKPPQRLIPLCTKEQTHEPLHSSGVHAPAPEAQH